MIFAEALLLLVLAMGNLPDYRSGVTWPRGVLGASVFTAVQSLWHLCAEFLVLFYTFILKYNHLLLILFSVEKEASMDTSIILKNNPENQIFIFVTKLSF